MKVRGIAAAAAILLLGAGYWQRCEAAPPVPACAANSDVLGLSRVVEVDTAAGPQFGRTPPAEFNFLEDGEVILTTDNLKSGRPLGWVRQYKRARVLCYQQGHDRRAYDHPNWRRVLSRGIQWVAGRL